MADSPGAGLINFLETIPNENLQEILLNLSIQDVGRACSTYKRIARFCRDDSFWGAYARSRGIEKGNSEHWREAVEKSNIVYTHVDLTDKYTNIYQEMREFGMPEDKLSKADVEYAIRDDTLVVKWHSGVPFNLREQEIFIKRVAGQLSHWGYFMSLIPDLTRSDKYGDIRLSFKIIGREKFDKYFSIKALMTIFLQQRVWSYAEAYSHD